MDFFKDGNNIEEIYSPVHAYNFENGMDKKNVVIIILESFSREFIGAFNKQLENGTYKGYTPFLDSLIEHSLVFPNAFANGRKSIDAMPSIITSIPALVLPYISSEYASNKVKGLPAILGEQGYSSAFFHGAPNGSMGFQSFAQLSGFDRYRGKTEYNNDADYDGIWGIWDEPFFQFYANEMSAMEEPFFTTIFSLSSHHPFKIPEQYEGAFPKGTMPIHQCVGYTDNALRQFFKTASKQKWFKNTLFVITADHNTICHYDKYKNNAGAFAIPLIFFSPGSELKGADSSVAQQTDIMPTVLHHLKYSKPFIAFGNNLLADDNRFAINFWSENYQLITDSLAIHFDGKKFSGLFDFRTDPGLKNNILPDKKDAKLEQFTKAVVQQFNNRMIEDRLTAGQQ